MKSETAYINSILIPRLSLAKRIAVLWMFEIMACLCGFGLFAIVSLLSVFEGIWLARKFRPVWSLYYHPATLYIVLVLLLAPSVIIGLALRAFIPWLILELPRLIF